LVVNWHLGHLRVFAFVGEQQVRHAHLDVVGFAHKDRDRLVLRLPAEAADRSVIAGVIEVARDVQAVALVGDRGGI
jgi:hypothetical protein